MIMKGVALKVAVVSLYAALTVEADMYDVIETQKVPPKSCAHGCADWSTLGSSVEQLWADPSALAKAGSDCAQPGNAVNSRVYGSWCYCKDNASQPIATSDPTHPFDGKVLLLQDVVSGRFVSFAYTDVPPGMSGSGTEWMRDNYPSENDAMPIQFHAVAGEANTYTMFNVWPGAQYEKWVGFTWGPPTYLRSNYDASDAMKIELRTTKSDDEYTLYNTWKGYEGYVGFNESPYWLRADQNVSNAMVVRLVPSSVAPQLPWDYCTSGEAVPEQINIQIASADTVVVSFVTFEPTAPDAPPIVRVGTTVNGPFTTVSGVTHSHVTSAGDRTYYMHFTKLTALKPRTKYFYQVQSGGKTAVPSGTISFTSAYQNGTTKINVYGDMGVYQWNNMANLQRDCLSGDADLIIQMGDHAYNEGQGDEVRGDGYMSAWQPILSQCPWMPIVGNHEYYDGAELYRFLNQTWEGWGPIPGGPVSGAGLHESTSATSALGFLLSAGNRHSTGTHGPVPSGTSRFFSVDYGLIHLVAIDLNMYYGVDPCGDPCRLAQLKWLQEDLAAANANRDAVPWIVVMSHYPFYCTGCNAKEIPAKWYDSSDAEYLGNANRTAVAAAVAFEARYGPNVSAAPPTRTLRQSSDASIADLIPIIHAAGVDMYLAGHWHYYESLYPAQNGKTGIGGAPIQKDFVNPPVTVHVTTGNGGPPGKDTFTEDCPGPDCGKIQATRAQTNEYSYGHLEAVNSTHLMFKQFFNSNSSLFDSFVLVQDKHGPFPPMKLV